ncbi:class I SAM-dependent methyltransferase [Candidatus Omnitrophota bacterium]
MKRIKKQDDWVLGRNQTIPLSKMTTILRWDRISNALAKSIKKHCSNFDQKVLDIGGGDSSFYHLIKKFCALYLNIEPSKTMISKFEYTDVNYICRGYGEYLPCKSEKFDIVIFNSVLDHCFNPALALSESRRVLKPRGKIFILLTNDGAWYKRLFKKHNLQRKMRCQEHNFYFSSDYVKDLLERENFDDIILQHFDFLLAPIIIEEFLFRFVHKKILLFFMELTDQLIGKFFPDKGGSFICIASK